MFGFKRRKRSGQCCRRPSPRTGKGCFLPKIAIAGSPNVGKSVLFNCLTGSYATVSNYPGTTVEVTRGRAVFGGCEYEVIDTPGAYSLLPVSEEERVTRDIFIDERPDVIVHVADSKNIERMLPLTLQLIETGIPVLLALNVIDEAEKLGINLDARYIEEQLGIPVAVTSGVTGRGITELKQRISNYARQCRVR